MNRDDILPVVAVLVGVCALVAYGSYRRSCRRAAGVPANLRQPLQTWEQEGGAVPDTAEPRPAQPAPEPPNA